MRRLASLAGLVPGMQAQLRVKPEPGVGGNAGTVSSVSWYCGLVPGGLVSQLSSA